MQLKSTSATRWQLLFSCITLLWSSASAVQQPLVEKAIKKLMRRERRHPSNSSPASTNSFQLVEAQQTLLGKKAENLMRRERRRSGTTPRKSTNLLELPLSPDGHPEASRKSDASSQSTPGYLPGHAAAAWASHRVHTATAAAASAISAPVDKSVPNHMSQPVPAAAIAEKGSSVLTSVHLDKSVDIPPKQVMVSAERPKLARTSKAAAVTMPVSPSESHKYPWHKFDGDVSKLRGDASFDQHSADHKEELHHDRNEKNHDNVAKSEHSTDKESRAAFWSRLKEESRLKALGESREENPEVAEVVGSLHNKKPDVEEKTQTFGRLQQWADRKQVIIIFANVGVVIFAILAGLASRAYSQYRARQAEKRSAWANATDRG